MRADAESTISDNSRRPSRRLSIPNTRWERLAPLSGIVFVALFIASAALVNFPRADDSAHEITSFYNDRGERAQQMVSGYLFVLAGVFFFWFLASLRVRLLDAEGMPGRLTSIAFGGGLVFVALVMVAGAIEMSVASNIAFWDEKFVNPESARLVPELAIPIVNIAAMFAAIAMVDAASVVIVRTRALPRWVGWFGFVIAVALLFAPFLPVVTLPLWVLVVSAALILTRPAPAR